MPNRSSYEPGTPNWIDLSSPDADASIAFYTTIFGWSAEDQFDGDGNRIYTLMQKDGKDVVGIGGQMDGMQGMPAMWNSYVCVDDAEQTVKAADAAGGTIIAPVMQVMESGSMAVIQDPTGAVICLWQPDQHIGAQVVNEPNTYTWNELLTRDVDTAKSFYASVFGWDYEGMDMGPMGIYNVVQGGENGGLAGIMNMPAEMPEQVPNHWMVYFNVEDADATIEAVVEAGGQVVNPAFDAPGVGRMASLHDPQGGSFSIMQPPTDANPQ